VTSRHLRAPNWTAKTALYRQLTATRTSFHSDAALSPQEDKDMNTPEWLKPGIYGAGIGAVFVCIVGFSWGGWVTGGTANDRAMAMSRDDVVASMVPVCLDIAKSDPAQANKLATIRAASTYQRRDALMKTGWATMPGTDAPNRDIAQACLAALDVDRSPEPATNAADEG
jgi:hypothetical protein